MMGQNIRRKDFTKNSKKSIGMSKDCSDSLVEGKAVSL